MTKPTKHIVAFIDILGFKDMIEKYFNGTKTDTLVNLEHALNEANSYVKSIASKESPQIELKIKINQFSDCVLISFDLNTSLPENITVGYFFMLILNYQCLLLKYGIATRGGVSIGGHYESSNMIFSEALVKSYMIESTKALYPRILIDKGVLEILDSTVSEYKPETATLYKYFIHSIIEDWDGSVFVSPFEPFYELDYKTRETLINQYIDKTRMSGEEISKDEAIKYLDFLASKESLDEFLDFTNKQIDSHNDEKSQSIKSKYIWLKELITWHKDSSSSIIKFKRRYK